MDDNDSFYKSLINNLFEGIYFVDRERRITFWNDSAERISGFSSAKVLGKICANNILNHVNEAGDNLCYNGCPLAATIQDGKLRKMEVYLLHAEGYRVPIIVHTSPIYDGQGNIIGAVESFTDNKELFLTKKKVQSLKKELEYDRLTGVGSRRSTSLRIRSALSELSSIAGQTGLIFIDIDRFKNINDTFGHEVGDRVLASVAQTMRRSIRSSDFMGRWGGEEFISIIYDTDAYQLKMIAEKLRLLVATTQLKSNDSIVTTTVSAGATLFHHKDTPKALLERADRLLYHSKENGRNQITFG